MHFHDKLIVITGGSSGIGFALARELLRQGARVVILGDQIERLEAAVAELGGRSEKVDGYVLDIAYPDFGPRRALLLRDAMALRMC